MAEPFLERRHASACKGKLPKCPQARHGVLIGTELLQSDEPLGLGSFGPLAPLEGGEPSPALVCRPGEPLAAACVGA